MKYVIATLVGLGLVLSTSAVANAAEPTKKVSTPYKKVTVSPNERLR